MEQSQVQSVSSGVGHDLRQAREAAGLTRADIAAQTKIAERHILAIEEGRFADLAGRTYAVGFARAYARHVGLDEGEIAARVKRQMDAQEPREVRMPSNFEPGDPARVPPRRLALVAAGVGALVLAVLGTFWSGLLSPEAQMPDLLSDAPAAPPPAAPAPAAAAAPVTPADPVSITAIADGIWIQVTDGSGAKLIERELKSGEVWVVPAGVQGAALRTGRPDALLIRVGGRTLPPLADKPMTISNVSLAPQALLAKSSGPAAVPSAAPTVPPIYTLPQTLRTPSRPRTTVSERTVPAPEPTAAAPVAAPAAEPPAAAPAVSTETP
ncbi:helix-turn-helix domain-containing protein [Novosphingobium colocasiae]|uniref:helix-turn-helix domain-containing protein n=1 Tax=Novosphingobium colocasiae TaxID=1256513 RepID=UPI0035AF3B6F